MRTGFRAEASDVDTIMNLEVPWLRQFLHKWVTISASREKSDGVGWPQFFTQKCMSRLDLDHFSTGSFITNLILWIILLVGSKESTWTACIWCSDGGGYEECGLLRCKACRLGERLVGDIAPGLRQHSESLFRVPLAPVGIIIFFPRLSRTLKWGLLLDGRRGLTTIGHAACTGGDSTGHSFTGS
jgi:hypothetical protein